MKLILVLLLTITACSSSRKLRGDGSSHDTILINKVLSEEHDSYKKCYSKLAPKDIKNEFKINVEFIIDKHGDVDNIKVSNKVSRDVSQCIMDAFLYIQFPAVKNGKDIKVKQPLIFHPKR